ncbi:MAG: CDP-alcohol phosphatidyltransferase family protein [Proteobacteria bacterium]|nr:CDP-alcohol phosphatidyltransferase family protein [Pseudomonadota bacterium]
MDNKPVSTACILDGDAVRVWHEASDERLKRALAQQGISRFLKQEELTDISYDIILVRPDTVIDAPALKALIDSPGVVLLSDTGNPVAAHASADVASLAMTVLTSGNISMVAGGLRAATSEELASTYWQALRKREIPYVMSVSKEAIRAVEWRMFMGTYKGATDFVTKWLWPRPAFYVTQFCAKYRITPNQVTSLSLILVFAALYWFYQGDWMLGLISAWVMTFLDTVDGKLARITLNSSKFGNVFDHSIDLIHPPFWYAAWGMGVMAGNYALEQSAFVLVMGIIVAGYVIQRIVEGISIAFFKIEIHVWRPVDTFFRQITARRNPNLVLLMAGAVAGRPDWGLIAVAAWTAISLGVHLLQIVQAALVMRREGSLVSWMAAREQG